MLLLSCWQAEAKRQADAMALKMEKMRKLQELALGGVGGHLPPPVNPEADAANMIAGRRPTGSRPSTRGRQLLYWESLKSKTQEQPSISWRGGNEFAHEQGRRPGGGGASPRSQVR